MNAPSIQVARLRRASVADLAELLALERHFPGDRLSARALRRLLRSPSARIWLAETDGQALAALVLLTRRGSRTARIYSLVVDPRARGRGLAGRLVTAAEAAARRAGCLRVSLEVRADNAAARRLYARLDYREQRALPAYYEDDGDGLRLVKLLAARREPGARARSPAAAPNAVAGDR